MVTLTVGQLSPYKGHLVQLLALARLRAAALLPKLCAVWVGTGPLGPSLHQLSRKLRVDDRLRLLGYRDDVPELLDAADAFILTSMFEGMPLVVLEAMAKGLPVAATAVSGVPEALGDTGRLLPDPNGNRLAAVTELAETLTSWILDPERRQSTGAASRGRAELLFREERMVREHVAVVERVFGPP